MEFLALILTLTLLSPALDVTSLQLDPDGGYHITVAIADFEQLPNATDVTESVKEMLDSFGAALHSSTDSIFFLKSVQILLPAGWSLDSAIEAPAPTIANFEHADMQISDATRDPVTENYYPCGKPGVRIQLPLWFLDASRTRAEFGSQSKGLLNLWLRYRFGVWEEYGYPQHPTTPYFYSSTKEDAEGGGPWHLTSCNSSKLLGDVRPIDYNNSSLEVAENCNLHNSQSPLHKDCRFYPDPADNQVAPRSSVMNFQWVESIQKLCDEGTHDKRAPNRQNLYCGSRSVWEIIRGSQDYKAVKPTTVAALKMAPTIQYTVATPSSKPLLYILLDLGHPDFTFKHTVYWSWLGELEKFVNALPSDVFVALASYPNPQPQRPYTDLVQHLDWTLLDSAGKREEILQVFNFTIASRLATDFNFRLPLTEVVSELKQKAAPGGSVLLALRTETITFKMFVGAAAVEQASGPYEEDILVDMKQNRISLFAVESTMDRDPTNVTLEYLALQSGGMYSGIYGKDTGPGEGDIVGMRAVLDSILEKVKQPHPPVRSHSQSEEEGHHPLIYKGIFANISQHSFLIPKPNVCDWKSVQMYVTVAGAKFDNVELVLGESDIPVPFLERTEWLPSMDDPRLSYTYSAVVHLSTTQSQNLWQLRLLVSDWPLGWMKGAVTMYGGQSADPSTCSESGAAALQLQAEIFTSASPSNNQFGCVGRLVNEEPLAVYAKLSFKGGLQQVPIVTAPAPAPILSAHLLHLRTGASISTPLRDDGIGADLLAGDGVYSGYLYPHLKDGWRLYVTINDITEHAPEELSWVVNPMGRIHSVGQADLEETVKGLTLGGPNSAAFEAPRLLRVTSECVAKRFISRVVDTQVAVVNDDKSVKVTFTVPLITTSTEGEELEDDTDISSYFVVMAYLAPHMDALIHNLTQESVQVQGFLIETTYAGQQVEVNLARGNATAYAMVIVGTGRLPTQSALSNIAQIRELHPEEPPGTEVGCLIGCVLLIEIVGGLVILLLVLALLLLWRRNRRQATKLRMLTRDEVKEFLNGVKVGPKGPNLPPLEDYSEQIQCLPYDKKYEIPANKLHIDKTELLGSGRFGNVYKGYAVNHGIAGQAGKVLIVAVKTMKPDMDKSYFKVLLAEVKLMTHIGGSHPNIIRLVGACTKNIRKCEVFLATEFCPNGNLSAYLLKKMNGTEMDAGGCSGLMKWAREIANGLEFLGRRKIIHGDVAARNILLDENLVAKVSDFGLSKQSMQYNYANYHEEDKSDVEDEVGAGGGGGLLPWKWVAPEVLTLSKFSVASDVWSYGVTLWEIFSLGQVPYPGIQWSPDFVYKLEHTGLRLMKPNLASDEVYDVMSSCWALEPKERAAFGKLKARFDQMLVSTESGEYLDLKAY